MSRFMCCSIVLGLLGFFSLAWSGQFEGELKLYPDNCWGSPEGICKLGSELTYKSSDGLVWQTDVWTSDEAESGLTDGASIPAWAQWIIGQPYDESYLKAAIVHDHYCYVENRVRPWRTTHRMFYDALVDLGVGSLKAKAMYFAVYLRGPRWAKLVPGERCGELCIKVVPPSLYCYRENQLTNDEHQQVIRRVYDALQAGERLSIEELEDRANSIVSDQLFFENGDFINGDGCPNGTSIYLGNRSFLGPLRNKGDR